MVFNVGNEGVGFLLGQQLHQGCVDVLKLVTDHCDVINFQAKTDLQHIIIIIIIIIDLNTVLHTMYTHVHVYSACINNYYYSFEVDQFGDLLKFTKLM